MTGLLVAWVALPLVLATLSLGCGLLLERVAGVRLVHGLVLPAGLAVVILAAQFAVLSSTTARLATPLVVALSVAGFGVALPLRRRGLWEYVAATATFVVYAAPIVLSGSATFAGYIKLDDTSTFLGMTDRVMEHGRSLAGLAPSSYEAALAVNLGNGYPLGALLPLGIASKLLGTDPAWLFQPCMAFFAAMLAVALYALAAEVLAWRPLRALAAFAAAQAALLYAFSLWGGLKELAAAPLVALVASLVPAALRAPLRAVVPAAAAAAAVVAVLSLGGAIWILPVAVPALVLALWTHARVRATARAAALAAVAVVLAVPSLAAAGSFLRHDNTATFTNRNELGNLVRPLEFIQLFGIWPTGDFRFAPNATDATHVLIAVVVVASIVGVAIAAIRRRFGVLLYAATALLVSAMLVLRASPWVAAKALATASPAFVLAALVGAFAVFERGRRVEGALAAAAVIGGVLWSNVLAYHDVWLAPHAQLRELESIGERFAGASPALMTQYQPYGVRHFLRRLDPEGASELRRRPVPLRSGGVLGKAEFADLDAFDLAGILVYRTLVLARSPVDSRPPSAYSRVWSGRFYDVWERSDAAPRILEHVRVGADGRAVARASCETVRRVARVAAARRGRVAAVYRTSALSSAIGSVLRFGIPVSGTYGVWVGGSFLKELEISVDGHHVGTVRQRLNHAGEYTPFGDVALKSGGHDVAVSYRDDPLRPGSGGADFTFGPLIVGHAQPTRVTYVSPDAAETAFCGRSLDWLEAVGG